MPEISIIVPVYKVEKYLNRCIDSILAQSFPDFELILVDDGSPDKSGKICDDYAAKDSRVKVIHKENAGVSAARNSGLAMSSGSYIMFCDSDDFVDKDWCGALYEAARDNNADMAVCGLTMIQNESSSTQIQYKGTQAVTALSRSLFCDVLETELFYSMCNKLYRAEIINSFSLRVDENLQYSEDFRFNLQYFMKMKRGFAVVRDALYNYDKSNEASATHRYAENYWQNQLRLFAQIKEAYRSADEASDRRTQMYTRFMNMICSALHNNMKKDNPLPFLKRFMENVRIVHSEAYKEAVTLCSPDAFHPVYYKVLKTRSYFLIYLCELFVRAKNRA